jgi:hypothetical protein
MGGSSADSMHRSDLIDAVLAAISIDWTPTHKLLEERLKKEGVYLHALDSRNERWMCILHHFSHNSSRCTHK